MALNNSIAIETILPAIKKAASLNDDFEPKKNEDGQTLQPSVSNNFEDEFANAYNEYAKSGIVMGALNEGAPTSIISDFIKAAPNSTASIDLMALGLGEYWSRVAIIPSVPAFGGVSVLNVSNNANTKVNDFRSAILNSITDQREDTPYKTLFDNLEVVIKSITWFVTELKSNGTTVIHPTGIE